MPQRPVELILARQLASGLAVPVLIVDPRGDTLFYNEPAGQIFGRRFDELEELSFEERSAALQSRDEHGQLLAPDELPGMLAMRDRQPSHATFYIYSFSGALHGVEATAIPLESTGGRLLGAFIVLWMRPENGEQQQPAR